MACYHPWAAGVFSSKPVACGRCIGCRLEYSRQWAMRCVHEASLYDRNIFLTLTYADDSQIALDYRHFRKFMKELRRSFPEDRIRYFMCGEYGEHYRRPHYHACLFNFDFPDRKYWRVSKAGSKLYRSAMLERLWPHGYSDIGMVTFESAAYVARYCVKQQRLPGNRGYEHVDLDTGAVQSLPEEFARMSLRPGIGAAWYEKFSRDMSADARLVVRGREVVAPRYYQKLAARGKRRVDGFALADKKHQKVLESLPESVPNRLEARRVVAEARLGLSKRKI